MVSHLLYRFSKARSRRHLIEWLDEAIAAALLGDSQSLISVGAGGEVNAHLAAIGLAVRTVDIDPARRPDLLANVENLAPLADASMDAIFCLEVLEHVADPQAAADAIWRVLRPGGWLIGSTPFLLGIHDAPHDYYRFTEHGLRYLFRNLQVVELRARNGYFDGIAVLIYRRFVTGPVHHRRCSTLLSPVLLLLGLVLEGIGRLLPSVDGTTGYFFVLRKPQT